MADEKVWPALVIRSGAVLASEDEDTIAALLDDFSPTAIQDLTPLPLPPGGLWDPTFPPPPEPPPAPLHWRVFFATAGGRDAARATLKTAFPALALAADEIPDEDWAGRSQRALTAIGAGRFIVAPPWDVPPEGEATVIVIEPSRGFGTGHHASTRLCLRALSEIDVRGARVLDLGTGSGVLAMAASVSGARDVVAVDIDPDAIDSARQSAALNPRVANIHWLIGDFRDRGWDALSGGPFHVVLANLTGGMLISSAARIRELLRREGILICSGFDQDEQPRVEAALTLSRRAEFVEDRWVGLVLSS
ncbi:MAG TPA: 50S ribosomal protein L11 methyltransferase [Vicinamibacterales bacterium]|nr:50S ribosomal protein L11 methyltransferase [Vicinamibacterales bacterium]